MWKVLLMAGLATSLIASPALAETADYGPSGTGVGTTAPVYERPIVVIDAMIGTLNPEHRRIWRQARDEALENWGLPFEIRRGSVLYEWTDENINAGLAITDIQAGAILIVRNYSAAKQTFGGWDPNNLGGIAAYTPWRPWWQGYFFSDLVGTIGHEIGHALGFGHGGTGIMAGNNKPNATELALAREYYA